jgi:hypothetical protein
MYIKANRPQFFLILAFSGVSIYNIKDNDIKGEAKFETK